MDLEFDKDDKMLRGVIGAILGAVLAMGLRRIHPAFQAGHHRQLIPIR